MQDNRTKSPAELLLEPMIPAGQTISTFAEKLRSKDLIISPFDTFQIHKALIDAYRSAQKANDAAKLAQHNAFQSQMRAYRALSAFESELQALEERTGFKAGADYVTTENEEDDGDAA